MGIKKPQPKAKNLYILIGYCFLISLLIFFLTNPIANKATLKNPKTHSLLITATTSFLVLWLFGAGIVILTVYKFCFSKKHQLKKPQKSSLAFYLAFVLWLAFFLTIECFIIIIDQHVANIVTNKTLVLTNLAITLTVNAFGVLLMYQYLGKNNQNLITWLKQKIRGQKKYTIKQLVFWGILGYIGSYPILVLSALINQVILSLFKKDFPLQDIVQFSAKNQTWFTIIVLFFSVGLLAPFFEEIIMRGLLFFGLLKNNSFIKAGIFSGFIFALFHFNIQSLIPITVLGTGFAWLYSRTGSLIPAIVAHSCFNIINFLLIQMLKM